MAFQTLKTKTDPVPLDAFGRDLARRRVEAGITDVPRNSGKRRTASKQALLQAVEAVGGRW